MIPEASFSVTLTDLLWMVLFHFVSKYMSHVMRKPVLVYANNKGADQPAHPRSLISAFVVRCLDSIIPLLNIAEILRL